MDVKEAGKLGGQATKRNNPNHYVDLARARFKGMSDDQIKEYMRAVRAGKKIKNA